jgi:hypothetical protein
MTTSNFDLMDIAKGLHYDLQVVLQDELASMTIGPDQNIIINLGQIGKGTHWTCLVTNSKKECFYFDSFGMVLPKAVQTFTKPYKTRYNGHIIQSYDSFLCGFYASAYIYWANQDKHNLFAHSNAFINKFDDDSDLNAGVLRSYFHNTILKDRKNRMSEKLIRLLMSKIKYK